MDGTFRGPTKCTILLIYTSYEPCIVQKYLLWIIMSEKRIFVNFVCLFGLRYIKEKDRTKGRLFYVWFESFVESFVQLLIRKLNQNR